MDLECKPHMVQGLVKNATVQTEMLARDWFKYHTALEEAEKREREKDARIADLERQLTVEKNKTVCATRRGTDLRNHIAYLERQLYWMKQQQSTSMAEDERSAFIARCERLERQLAERDKIRKGLRQEVADHLREGAVDLASERAYVAHKLADRLDPPKPEPKPKPVRTVVLPACDIITTRNEFAWQLFRDLNEPILARGFAPTGTAALKHAEAVKKAEGWE